MILCLQGTFVVTKDANLIFKYHPITMNDFKDMHVTTHTLCKGRLLQHVSSVIGIEKTIKETYTSSVEFYHWLIYLKSILNIKKFYR